LGLRREFSSSWFGFQNNGLQPFSVTDRLIETTDSSEFTLKSYLKIILLQDVAMGFISKILVHAFVTLLPLIAVFVGHNFSVLNLMVWAPLGVVFALIPLIDKILLSQNISSNNISDGRTPMQDNIYAVFIVVVQVVIYIGAIWSVTNLDFSIPAMIAFIVSIFASTIINCGPPGHKLIHGKSIGERFCAAIVLDLILFPSFKVEHMYHHHKHANTAKDIFNSKMNDPLYQIVWRSIKFNVVGVWSLQKAVLIRKNKAFFSRYNYLLTNYAVCAAFLAIAYSLFGLIGVLIYVGISFLTIVSIFSLSYVEHYGLTDNSGAQGWSYGGVVTNLIFNNHQIHSNHHKSPGTHHAELKLEDTDLQYPLNYTAMFVLALIPPLWYRVVNPIITKNRLNNG